MKQQVNPFTPSFGEIPAHLAGRKQIINATTAALKFSYRAPELTSLFAGARGTGKTALLSYFAQKAEGLGWVSVSTTAMPGMLDDIEILSQQKASHLLDNSKHRKIQSVEISGVGGVSFANNAEKKTNWRSRMNAILDELAKTETGLLITVDEINPSLDELVLLSATYQHFLREGRKVSLMMAGLPANIFGLVTNKTVSFLRRSQMQQLKRISDFEIEETLRRTITENGRTANSSGIAIAVQAIAGFPFLLQLVGYRSWNVNENSTEISKEDFEIGIELAKQEMKTRILESTIRELSESDKRFLYAMLQDENETTAADLKQRLKWSSSQIAQYRKRLIDAGVIGSRGRGVVGFDMPYFREFLNEQM